MKDKNSEGKAPAERRKPLSAAAAVTGAVILLAGGIGIGMLLQNGSSATDQDTERVTQQEPAETAASSPAPVPASEDVSQSSSNAGNTEAAPAAQREESSSEGSASAATDPVNPSQDARITVDQARQIALDHAGLTEDQVQMRKMNLDWDDGRQEYEIEFYRDGMEYEYTIDASDGTILEADRDIDDD